MVGDRFSEIMQPGRTDLALDEAALLISAALQPGVDPAVWMSVLDQLAADCAEPTADAVAEQLFTAERFVGDRGTFYDWRNSCLDRVIQRRSGIPISLSILMIEVARRVGTPLVGVGMPAHFLVRAADDRDVFFDPFDGGRRLDRAGARAVFETATNGQVPWNEHYLEPSHDRDIVIRMLNNLKGVFTGRSDTVRLAMVMNLRAAVPELAELEAAEITTSSAVFN